MITTAELHRTAQKEGLRFDQAEKDYVILWLLSGLAHSGVKDHGWMFKGGTCLRHCYYEGYRFSEDIDFSCRPGGKNLEDSLSLLEKASRWIFNESGVRFSVGKPVTSPGDFQIEIPMTYNRGGARRQRLPQVKVHLTFDEPVFNEKCRIRDIQPDTASLTSDRLREWNENAWGRQLGPMLKDLPDFDLLWKEWVESFHKMIGKA